MKITANYNNQTYGQNQTSNYKPAFKAIIRPENVNIEKIAKVWGQQGLDIISEAIPQLKGLHDDSVEFFFSARKESRIRNKALCLYATKNLGKLPNKTKDTIVREYWGFNLDHKNYHGSAKFIVQNLWSTAKDIFDDNATIKKINKEIQTQKKAIQKAKNVEQAKQNLEEVLKSTGK